MKLPRNIRAIGIIAGFALFFGVGLLSIVAANETPLEHSPQSASVAESAVAPAEQLGRAFAAVAAHIRPAVVSVYSHKY